MCIVPIMFLVVCHCSGRITAPLHVSTVTAAQYPIGIDIDAFGNVLYTEFFSCTVVRLANGSPPTVIAGSSGSCGFADGIGITARFLYPCGIARVGDSNTLYIADENNHRVRVLDLTTNAVTTLTGSSEGYGNGPFVSALFNAPTDVHYHVGQNSEKVLYIVDFGNSLIRKAALATGNVTTVASVADPLFGCLNKNGTLLFLATNVQTIVRVDIAGEAATTVAGSSGVAAFLDGVGTEARFSSPRGVTFNEDETVIYIGDWKNHRVRRIQLSNWSVTTTAGSGNVSSVDGQLLTSTFQALAQIRWHCDYRTTTCGIIATEYVANGSIRWIPISQGTVTMSLSLATNGRSATATETVLASSSALSATESSGSSCTQSVLPSSSLPQLRTISTVAETSSMTQWFCNRSAAREMAVSLVAFQASGISSLILHANTTPLAGAAVTTFALLHAATSASYAAAAAQDTQSAPVAIVRSQPIDRIFLLQAPTVACNLSIRSSSPLLHYFVNEVNKTSMHASSATRSRDGTWHEVIVQPPTAGWVADSTFPLLRDFEFSLLVTFGCGDIGTMLSVQVAVPSPGVPRKLADYLRSGTTSILFVSVLATGAISGSVLARVVVTDSIAMCSANDVGSGGVMDLGLVICEESPELIEARSAIVSNVVLVASVLAVLLTLSASYWFALNSMNKGSVMPGYGGVTPMIDVMTGVFLLPSSILPVVTSVIPSTAAAATFLAARVASSACVAVDVVLIFLGALLVAAPVSAISKFIFVAPSKWNCVATQDGRAPRNGVVNLTLAWRNAVRRNWKWRATDDAHIASLRPAWIVLLEYRVLWYAAAEMMFLVAISSLAVIGGLSVYDDVLCRGCSAAVVLLLALQFVVLCVWRPFTTLFSLIFNAATTGLTFVSVAAQLLFLLTSSSSTSGLWLLEASAVCNLLVLGACLVKMTLDAVALWRAVRRRTDRFCFSKETVHASSATSLSATGDTPTIADHNALMKLKKMMMNPEESPPVSLTMDHDNQNLFILDTERPADFESMFWDDSGRAKGTSQAEHELNILLSIPDSGQDNA
jgi:DNA-binding beta-propeller fold protein YncE